MAAHNEVNGMPCHANAELNAALRETFGFGKGLCASDAGDVSSVAKYRVASDQTHAGALSLLSGMDQDLEFPGAFAKVPDMLKLGLINMSDVDRAVGNVLRQKIAAGLMDNNDTLLYVDPVRHDAVVGAPAHRELARTVAEEGITLLKNDIVAGANSDGSSGHRLPLTGLGKTGGIKTIAVIGPNADNAHSHLGLYGTGEPIGGTRTVLNATIAAANATGNAWVVQYEKGSCLGGCPGCPCTTGEWAPSVGSADSIVLVSGLQV
jgi:beta-glucosidase